MRTALTLLPIVAVLAIGALFFDRVVAAGLYHPERGSIDPTRFGIEAADVFLEAEDGVRVHAYHLVAPGADRAILFLHGNAGNASHRLPNAEMLRRLGADVLLLDYRGYGRSEGRPSEPGLYADARAALAHLSGVLGFPERRVVVFGRSLGGAVAADLASGRDLAGVILESTFSSLADAGATHGASVMRPLLRGRYASDRKLAGARAPLLFIHGDRDDIVPLSLGRKLFDAAPEPKRFETIAGAGHNDLVAVGGGPYLERIREFLDTVTPPRAR